MKNSDSTLELNKSNYQVNDKSNVLNNPIIIALLILPLIEPSGVEDMSVFLGGIWRYIHLSFVFFKAFSFFVVTLISIKRINRFNKTVYIIMIYQAMIAIVTIINGTIALSHFIVLFTPIIAVWLADYYLSSGNIKRFIQVFSLMLCIVVVLNFISILIWSDGIYIDDRGWKANWFLGYRNRFIYYFLPAIFLCGISQYIIKGKMGMMFYFLLIIIVASSFMVQSTTTMISMVFVGVMVLLFENRNLPKIITIWNEFIVSFVISILFVFFSYQKYFSDYIIRFLGKDATFSNRTMIWERAVADFFKKPVFGNGFVSYDNLFIGWTVGQMHNMFMDILVTGGIVLMVVFIILVLITHRSVNKCNIAAIRNIATVTFMGYGILFITEARRDVTLLFVFFIICSYLPDIINQYNIKETKKHIYRYKRIKVTWGRKS